MIVVMMMGRSRTLSAQWRRLCLVGSQQHCKVKHWAHVCKRMGLIDNGKLTFLRSCKEERAKCGGREVECARKETYKEWESPKRTSACVSGREMGVISMSVVRSLCRGLAALCLRPGE